MNDFHDMNHMCGVRTPSVDFSKIFNYFFGQIIELIKNHFFRISWGPIMDFCDIPENEKKSQI